MAKILIIDDEKDITKLLDDYFRMKGHDTIVAYDGEEAMKKIESGPDIILLDINMPKLDGIEVCKRIRNHISCPILFLTAKIDDMDKLLGFRVGADDYIVKPFHLDILGARVEAHLRRETRHSVQNQLKFWDDLVINYSTKEVFCKDIPISFPKKEFEIIELLSSHPGQVFDKERIYELIWGYDSESMPSVITEHIRRIRKRLEKVCDKEYIETLWGVGYRWKS